MRRRCGRKRLQAQAAVGERGGSAGPGSVRAEEPGWRDSVKSVLSHPAHFLAAEAE